MSDKKKMKVISGAPELVTEAAIDLFEHGYEYDEEAQVDDPLEGDEDTDDTEIDQIVIEVAANGYMLTFYLDDGSEEKSVHTDFDEVLETIRGRY